MVKKQYYFDKERVRGKRRPLTLSLTPQEYDKQGLSSLLVRV